MNTEWHSFGVEKNKKKNGQEVTFEYMRVKCEFLLEFEFAPTNVKTGTIRACASSHGLLVISERGCHPGGKSRNGVI